MTSFVELYTELDHTTSSDQRRTILRQWDVSHTTRSTRQTTSTLSELELDVLCGKNKRRLRRDYLINLARTACGLPDWLFDECLAQASDVSELISVLLPDGTDVLPPDLPSILTIVDNLVAQADEERDAALVQLWSSLHRNDRFVLTRLLSGSRRAVLRRTDLLPPTQPELTTTAVEEYPLKAVILYVEVGYSSAESTYTVGLRSGESIVPLTRLSARTLSDSDRSVVNSVVKTSTRERFGPVRSIDATLVVDMVFTGLEPSSRRKSGLNVVGARLCGLSPTSTLHDVATIEELQSMWNDILSQQRSPDVVSSERTLPEHP